MLLLVTSAQLDAIKLLSDFTTAGVTRPVGQQLVIADASFSGSVEDDSFTREVLIAAEGDTPAVYGRSVALSTEMFALEARPVSLPYQYQFNEGSEEWEWVETEENTLWLLPIVDMRWFGQWVTISQGVVWDTWKQGIELCIDRIGVKGVDDVHPDYGVPNETLATGSDFANAPEIADTLAHTVGQRISRRIDGTIESVNVSTAQTTWDNNFAGDDNDPYEVWRRIAGGEYTNKHKSAATLPEKIRVVFSGGAGVTKTTSEAGATQWGVTGTYATLFPASNGGSDQTAFALQAAKDYVEWQSRKADMVFAGVKAWRLTGFEDVVLWSVCTRTGITTRVVTHPENLATLPTSHSAASDCIETYEFKLMWNPTEATITLHVKYNEVTEDVEITRAMDAAAIQAALNTHSEFIAAGEFCSVSGAGYLYNSNMVVWLPAGATIEGFSAVMTTREYSPTAEFYVNICSCRGAS
jgi:hypothetical protein